MYASDHTFAFYRKLLDTGGIHIMSSYQIISVGQRMQKLLTTNDLAGILRLKPIQE